MSLYLALPLGPALLCSCGVPGFPVSAPVLPVPVVCSSPQSTLPPCPWFSRTQTAAQTWCQLLGIDLCDRSYLLHKCVTLKGEGISSFEKLDYALLSPKVACHRKRSYSERREQAEALPGKTQTSPAQLFSPRSRNNVTLMCEFVLVLWAAASAKKLLAASLSCFLLHWHFHIKN